MVAMLEQGGERFRGDREKAELNTGFSQKENSAYLSVGTIKKEGK